MWCFAWIRGAGFAMTFCIINVIWLEAEYFCKIEPGETRAGKS
ncbi:MAG: CydX/CbdX family cytochrome bd oxidase small subunit [Gallionella sp.]